jgi:hypothetical protein
VSPKAFAADDARKGGRKWAFSSAPLSEKLGFFLFEIRKEFGLSFLLPPQK